MKVNITTLGPVVDTSAKGKSPQRGKSIRAVRPNLSSSRRHPRTTADQAPVLPTTRTAPSAATPDASSTDLEAVIPAPAVDPTVDPTADPTTSTQFSDAVVFLPMAEAGALFPEPTAQDLQAEPNPVESMPADLVKPATAVVEDTSIIGRGRYDEHTSLRLYLRDAVATDLLTPAQEIELAHRKKRKK